MSTPSRLPSIRRPATGLPEKKTSATAEGRSNTSRPTKPNDKAPIFGRLLPQPVSRAAAQAIDQNGNNNVVGAARYGGTTAAQSMTSGQAANPQQENYRIPASKPASMPPPPAPSRSTSIRRPVTGIHRSGLASGTPISSARSSEKTPPETSTATTPLQRSTSIRKEDGHSRAKSSMQTQLPARSQLSYAGHTRTSSTSSLGMDGGAAALLPITKAEVPGLRPPQQQSLSSSRLKPGFSTHQQHFSPAKSALPKPPVPSVRALSLQKEEATPVIDTFEMTKLQSELLYLTLLHESSFQTQRQYLSSAKRTLRKKYDTIYNDESALEAREKEIQTQVNIHALSQWSPPDTDLADNIHRLSSCISEATALTETGGKHDALVQDYETWLVHADAIANARTSAANASPEAELFNDPLPESWHQAHASVTQRVRMLKREIDILPPLPATSKDDGDEKSRPPASALEITLRKLREVVKGMQDELFEMVRVEEAVIEQERQWIEDAVVDTLRAEDGGGNDRLVPSAWH